MLHIKDTDAIMAAMDPQNREAFTPDRVLELLRLVRVSDQARLRYHPYAMSKAIAAHVERLRAAGQPHDASRAIVDLVSTLLVRRLAELRRRSATVHGGESAEADQPGILGSIRRDVSSRDAELEVPSIGV
jgi:hypothetical protein